MARGGHRLPKVSPRPAMPFFCTPCGQVTPDTDFGRLLPIWDTPHCVPMLVVQLETETLHLFQNVKKSFSNTFGKSWKKTEEKRVTGYE
jgi:hypothetical protein